MIVPATLDHAAELAPAMRPADRAEVWAAGLLTPLAALELSVERASHAWSWVHQGEVLAMGGVAPGQGGMLGREGVVWLLGSTEIGRHPALFLRMSLVAIGRALAAYPVLHNVTDARHHASHRWLRWLGARFGDPVPFGPLGLPFIPFHIRA